MESGLMGSIRYFNSGLYGILSLRNSAENP